MKFINLSFWRRRLFALTTKIYPAILRKVYGMDIGKNCVISRKARLDRAVNPKGVHIGDGTWILAGAGVLSHDACRSLKTDTYVGNNCVIGIRSLILPGVKVGDSTVVAACSVVTKNTPPHCIVAGNPAKVIKTGVVVRNGKIVEPGQSVKNETE